MNEQNVIYAIVITFENGGHGLNTFRDRKEAISETYETLIKLQGENFKNKVTLHFSELEYDKKRNCITASKFVKDDSILLYNGFEKFIYENNAKNCEEFIYLFDNPTATNNETFYKYDHSKNEFIECLGTKHVVHGLTAYLTVENKQYCLIESQSGFVLAQGTTEEDVFNQLNERMAAIGIEFVKEKIKKSVEHFGLSPLYKAV